MTEIFIVVTWLTGKHGLSEKLSHCGPKKLGGHWQVQMPSSSGSPHVPLLRQGRSQKSAAHSLILAPVLPTLSVPMRYLC